LLGHPLRVVLAGFLHIHTLLLTFLKIKKAEKIKNVKKRDLNKKVKNVYYIYVNIQESTNVYSTET